MPSEVVSEYQNWSPVFSHFGVTEVLNTILLILEGENLSASL
jgi:hypothetical protein